MPLGEVVFPAVSVTIGVLWLWVGRVLLARRERARMALWRDAAAEAGLRDLVARGNDVLSGSAGPFRLQLSEFVEDEARGTRVEIRGPRLAPGLRLRPEDTAVFLGLRDRKEVEVGDDDFDREVSVQGPPALALALLDAEQRRCVRSLVSGRLEVRGHRWLWASGRLDEGVLRIDVPARSKVARGTLGERGDEPHQAGLYYLDGEHLLPQVLRAALDLAARLSRPDDVAARLGERLASEPEARVRLKLLLMLLREFPEHAAARQAAVAARDDPDASVRLRAGIALGAEGRNVLLGIAGGEGAEDDTSARAVAALGDSLTSTQVRDFLKTALRTQREATARRCLKILGRLGGPEAIHALTQVLTVESGLRRWPSALAIDAAAALADTGDTAVEPALLEALRSRWTPVGIAAAQALGHVGTANAVIPLREAEVRDASLRRAARQAVAEIQARLGGASPGQLSLAESEPGRLSLAEGESGQLSIADGASEPVAEGETPQRSAGRLKTTQ